MSTLDRRRFLETAAALSALAALRPRAASAAGAPKKAVLISMLPKELSFRDRFQTAVDAGFAGIEMQTVADARAADDIKEAAGKTGLRVHSVMNSDHWTYPLSSPDPEVVGKSVAGMETSLRNAKLWGADALAEGHPRAGVAPGPGAEGGGRGRGGVEQVPPEPPRVRALRGRLRLPLAQGLFRRGKHRVLRLSPGLDPHPGPPHRQGPPQGLPARPRERPLQLEEPG